MNLRFYKLIISAMLTVNLLPNLSFASAKDFAKLCERRDLPQATATTVASMRRFAGGPFNRVQLDCREAAQKLYELNSITLHGQTFEYYRVEDLTPFSFLDNLERLDISNQYAVVDLSPLRENHRLRSLDISNTGIKGSNLAQLEHASQITSLGVSVNQDSLIELLRLPALTSLTLSHDFKEEGSPNVDALNISILGSLVHLTKLHVFQTEITGLSLLRTLENLLIYGSGTFDSNELKNLPLKTLSLDFLQDSQLLNEASLANLTGLESLTLHNAGLKNLNSLKNLNRLNTLDVANNNIERIEPILNHSLLENLNLSHNRLGFLFEIKNLTRLKNLDVSDNRLGGLDIRGFPVLEKLNASSNYLTDLSVSVPYPILKELEMSHNSLRGVKFLTGMTFPSLEFLNLATNRIFKIDSLGSINSLKQLTFDDNRVIDVSSLAPLTQIERLSARSNLITNPYCPVEKSKCDFLYQGQ